MTARAVAVVLLALAVPFVGIAGPALWEIAHGDSGCHAPTTPLEQRPVCQEPRP